MQEWRRKAGLSTLLFSSLWLLIGRRCCFPPLLGFQKCKGCITPVILSALISAHKQPFGWLVNSLCFGHIRSRGYCNALSKHRREQVRVTLCPFMIPYKHLSLFLSPSSARWGQCSQAKTGPYVMAPFFSPDPGVSLQPSVVYSTLNSLVIAYVVILPLENILWLQVTNFYCLGSEVKARGTLGDCRSL